MGPGPPTRRQGHSDSRARALTGSACPGAPVPRTGPSGGAGEVGGACIGQAAGQAAVRGVFHSEPCTQVCARPSQTRGRGLQFPRASKHAQRPRGAPFGFRMGGSLAHACSHKTQVLAVLWEGLPVRPGPEPDTCWCPPRQGRLPCEVVAQAGCGLPGSTQGRCGGRSLETAPGRPRSASCGCLAPGGGAVPPWGPQVRL